MLFSKWRFEKLSCVFIVVEKCPFDCLFCIFVFVFHMFKCFEFLHTSTVELQWLEPPFEHLWDHRKLFFIFCIVASMCDAY